MEFCSKKTKKKLYDAIRYMNNPDYYLKKANEWKDRNPERVAEIKHDWYLKVKPEHNKTGRLRHQLHREEDNKNARDRYYKNRESRIKQSLEYQKKNPEKVNANHRDWNHRNPEKNLGYKIKNLTREAKESKMTKTHYTRTLQAWGNAVKIRDKVCQWCGTAENLQAHHILRKEWFIEERFDMDNGITLCFDDHKEAERLQKS